MAKFRLAPINYDGWKFIIGFALAGAAFLFLDVWFQRLLGGAFVLLAIFCVNFFRDPDRPEVTEDVILSPADGTVMEIVKIDGEGYGPGQVVRIFLSVFDIHVQRAPAAGTVQSVRYQPGLFLDARDPRAAFANENNSVEIASDRGRIVVKQISGLIARRIICWVREDDRVERGERIGLIRFGSQVDMYLPLDAEISVREGDKVMGGLTVVARWGQAAGGSNATADAAAKTA